MFMAGFIDYCKPGLLDRLLQARLAVVYQARPSFAAAIMPFQHTRGEEGLADVIYIHR